MTTLPKNSSLGALRIVETLAYYDEPTLFICENEKQQVYLAVAVEQENDSTRWLYAPISRQISADVLAGRIELRTAFIDADGGKAFLVDVPRGNRKAAVQQVASTSLTDDLLPERGCKVVVERGRTTVSHRSPPRISTLLAKSRLDDSQKAFCGAIGGPVRLLAPAGSGKTLSLLWRCLNIDALSDDQKPRFLVVTFTRAARDELKDRLNLDSVYAPVRSQVEVSTLNSWGFRRLRSLATTPKLLSTDADRYFCIQNLLQPVWKKHATVEKVLTDQRYTAPKAIMALLDSLKGLGFIHEDHKTFAAFQKHMEWLIASGLEGQALGMLNQLGELELIDPLQPADKQLKQAFDRFFRFWLDACQQMFDSAVFSIEDQKYWAFLDLRRRLGKKEALNQYRYHHLLVDEFQDINTLDLNLLKTIAAVNKAEVTILGDDDQAIYEWRGATPQFILNPQEHFGGEFETCTLEVNYRSPKNIVELSQKLISHNKNRVPKPVRAASTQNARIDALQLETLTDSINHVVATVEEVLAGKHPGMRTVGIIARKRSQIIPYQIIFASKDISFCAAEDLQIFLSKAFNDLKEMLLIKSRAGYPRSSTEVVEDVLKLCDSVKRYPLNKKDKQGVRSHLTLKRPRNLPDGIAALLDYKGSLKGSNDDGTMAGRFVEEIAPFLKSGTVADTIRLISESFQGMRKDYGKSMEDIFYADPPFLYLSEYAERYGADFVGFIEDIDKAVATLANLPVGDDSPDKVWKHPIHLMTALRAKGKEFDVVIVLDVNGDIWPIKLAVSDAQKEQERRIFYVAVTRARKRLLLLTNRSILGDLASPSPYLDEMGLKPKAAK